MVYKLHLLYLIVAWSSLVLGRPWENNQEEQLAEYEEIPTEQPTSLHSPSTSKKGKSCSFDKETKRYVCSDAISHQLEKPCNADDKPDCLTEGIHDPKNAKNDSKNKPCSELRNPFCTGPPMTKRNDITTAEKSSDKELPSCNQGNVFCLLTNRRSLRTLSRLKRRLEGFKEEFGTMNDGIHKNCNNSDNYSNCKRLMETTSIKEMFKRRAKKIPCKNNARDKFCRWRPQPLTFVDYETRKTDGIDWQ